MQLKSTSEALFVACRMEESAIELYQRALMICSDELCPMLQNILKQERQHLCYFRSLGDFKLIDEERILLLSTFAEGILYSGGLHGAARNGLLSSSRKLLELAAKSEQESAVKYRSFAEFSEGKAKEMLLFIADEENRHYQDLCKQCL